MNNPLNIDSYDYSLPKELIAINPVYPRDSAKLLVYYKKSGKIEHKQFTDIINLIPNNTTLIFNDTKVIKARIYGKKTTGGKIELLLNREIDNNRFSVYINGKVKIGTELLFDNNLIAIVENLVDDGSRIVSFKLRKLDINKNQKDLDLDFYNLNKILEKIGHIPLPPYIKRDDKSSDKIDYQPLFAKNIGAVAAPTASLHFTEELLNNVKEKFKTAFITLHVGAGTFKPVDVKNILEHKMHSEYYYISDNTKKIIDSDDKILAFGTTVTRTIEYYFREKKIEGESNLFLHPNNKPQRVNYLLTNFHLPKSTLIMLVASFIGIDETKRVYQEAIDKKYRFFSYGDAMLII